MHKSRDSEDREGAPKRATGRLRNQEGSLASERRRRAVKRARLKALRLYSPRDRALRGASLQASMTREFILTLRDPAKWKEFLATHPVIPLSVRAAIRVHLGRTVPWPAHMGSRKSRPPVAAKPRNILTRLGLRFPDDDTPEST